MKEELAKITQLVNELNDLEQQKEGKCSDDRIKLFMAQQPLLAELNARSAVLASRW